MTKLDETLTNLQEQMDQTRKEIREIRKDKKK